MPPPLISVRSDMGTLNPIWFVGINTPWTLSKDKVGRKTYQLAAKLWCWLGLAMALFLPQSVTGIIILVAVVIMSFIPIIYSFILYRQEKRAAKES